MKKIIAILLALICVPAAAQNYLRDDGTFHSVVEGTTSGQVLVNSGGLLAGSTGVPLVIGTTPISSGSNSKTLFDNAGVVGEYQPNVPAVMVCDDVTDNTSIIQTAWTLATARGVDVWLNATGTGGCLFSGVVQPAPTGMGKGSFLTGPGASLVKLVSTVTGTNCAITINVTYGVNAYLNGAYQGFTLQRSALNKTGRGWCVNGLAQTTFRDITTQWFDIGMYMTDNILIGIYESRFFQNNNAIVATKVTDSSPNGWNIENNHFVANAKSTLLFTGAGLVNIANNEFESNGGSGSTFATVDLTEQPAFLGAIIGINYVGNYMEDNRGTEVRIDKNGGTWDSVHNINNNLFGRSTALLTAGILLINSGASSFTTINVGGNSFTDGIGGTFSWLAAQTPATTNYTFSCAVANRNDRAATMPAACRNSAADSVMISDSSNQYVGLSTTIPSSALPTVNSNIGTFGDATHVGQFTVTAKGVITAASSVLITGASPTGAASGDLTGTYPNPTLAAIISAGGPTGSATVAPIITYDAKGRLTAVSSATITPAFSSITGQATLAQFPNMAANTALVNATSDSTVPTAFAMPSCSTAASALIWTTSTGFGCNTSITAAAVPASGLTGTTLAAGVTASSLTSFGASPALTTPVITGLPTGTGVATANTVSTLVARDGSGNFSAGTITASLTGHGSLDCALAGCTMSGAIAMGTNAITGLTTLASAGIMTFQSNGSTFAGSVSTGQLWFLGSTSLTPAAGSQLTVSQNAGGTPATSAFGNLLGQFIATDAAIGTAVIDTFNNQGVFASRHASGTQASKTASGGAITTFSFGAQGWDTAAYTTGATTDFLTTATTWSATQHGMLIRFRTTADTASATLTERMRLQQGLSVGNTTDPGAGVVSATNGYVANALAGITTVCTIAVGNVLTFTLGILTAKGGVAGCT